MLVALIGGYYIFQSAKDGQTEKSIKVMLVEFATGSPISDMKIEIKDSQTNEVIMEKTADANGEVIIQGLVPGNKYLFAPSSIFDDGTGSAAGVAQVVQIEDSTNYVVLETYNVRDHKGANVPIIMQNPMFPHGCEITSLTSVLRFFGERVTKESMEHNYLIKEDFKRTNNEWIGPDPAKKYAGNPADIHDGMYAFAPVIEQTAKDYIRKTKTKLKVENMTGASKQQVLDKVKRGIPVITWVTLDLSKPMMKDGWKIKGTDETIRMYRNLHVVVVTGNQKGKVIVMDPLKGYVAYDEDKFFKSFKEMNSQAIVLEK